jgi:two-component system, OmpR family, sensor histidine kinase KdpD
MKAAIEIEDEDLVLRCDRQLMVMLLTQYIDNACKYSNFGTTITIRVLAVGAEAIFSVNSFGPVIPMADRERIFDRYYRSSATPTALPARESDFPWPSARRRFTAAMFG